MLKRDERRAFVYVDLESVREIVEANGGSLAEFAGRVVTLARGYGRVLSATAYGDVGSDDARELRRRGCEPTLTSEDGEGSAPESISLALDALEDLVDGPAADVVVAVTDDAQLGELVRRMRRRGRFTVVISPAALEGQEPLRSADRPLSVESLLAGEVEADTSFTTSVGSLSPRPRETSRLRPVAAPLDLESYDWSRLILLLRDLEAKMPFVGMRWLKNKVVGPHNVGAASLADKQALLNRAVDEGILETYRVGNREEGGEPVTACRLVRDNERVREVLAAHPAPVEPEGEEEPEAAEAGES